MSRRAMDETWSDETRLDDFSRGFAAVLFSGHPDWRGHARVEGAGAEGGHLVVEVPCPNAAVHPPVLHVTTEGAEVTVSFDAFHTHFRTFDPARSEEDRVEALAFVAGLLAERAWVASGWSGEPRTENGWAFDRWRGSWMVAEGEPAGVSKYVTGADRVRVRSWRGTHDADGPAD